MRKKKAPRRRLRPKRVEVVKAVNGYAVRVVQETEDYSEPRESIHVASTPAQLAKILVEALG